jgi:transcriptional regulator with XRE-family HTH domain
MNAKMNDRIKALRVEKKLNQSQLGEILGVKQRTISDIEKGVSNPTVTQIEKLSKFFNVSSDYLLFGIEPEKEIEPIEREILKTIRDNKTLYGSLIEMMQSQKKVFNNFDNFERLAA